MSRTVPWQDGRRAWERLNHWYRYNPAEMTDPAHGPAAMGALREVQLIRNLLDMAELNAVLVARRHGHSWVEIATSLGIGAETAKAKWGEADGPGTGA